MTSSDDDDDLPLPAAGKAPRGNALKDDSDDEKVCESL
jgi:hypothetical protein